MRKNLGPAALVKKKMRAAGTILPLLALLLAACNMMGDLALAPPTPMPLPTAEPTPAGATEVSASPQPTTAPGATTDQEPAGPPTRTPPEGGGPVPLDPLAGGSPLELARVTMIDEQRGWGIGGLEEGDDRVLRTEDGGQRWHDVTPPLFFAEGGAELALQAAFLDDERAWVLRYQPVERPDPPGRAPLVVWATEDGGRTWRQGEPRWLPFLGTADTVPYLDFIDGERGWLLGRRGGAGMHQYPVVLLHSADGGTSWTVQEDPFEGVALQGCHKSGMDFGGSGVGLLSIDNCPVVGPEIRLTVDGGESWGEVTLPEPADPPNLYDEAGCSSHSPVVFSDESWAVGATCRTFAANDDPHHFHFRTTDGGDSWANHSAPTGSLQAVGPDQWWALGREIYRSTDGGETWEQRKLVSWDGQFSFVSLSTGWAVARSGAEIALVTTTDGAETWSILEPVVASGGGG